MRSYEEVFGEPVSIAGYVSKDTSGKPAGSILGNITGLAGGSVLDNILDSAGGPSYGTDSNFYDFGFAQTAGSVTAAHPKNVLGATQPVSINGIEFDALIEESRKFSADVPQYSVETGFSVTDSIIINQEELSMTLYVTNTPVTWHNIHGGTLTRVADICQQLEDLFMSREVVTVVTSARTYENMAIDSLELKKSEDTGFSREIPISFKKIRVTTAALTTIPEEYARAGKTKKKSGSGSGDGTTIPDAGDVISNEMESAMGGAEDGSILWHVKHMND